MGKLLLSPYTWLALLALWVGSLFYAANMGSNLKEAEWVQKVAILAAAQQVKKDQEIDRIKLANAEAKAQEAFIIRDMEATISELHVLLRVSTEEAKADPEAKRKAISKDAARRIGAVR